MSRSSESISEVKEQSISLNRYATMNTYEKFFTIFFIKKLYIQIYLFAKYIKFFIIHDSTNNTLQHIFPSRKNQIFIKNNNNIPIYF